MVDALVEELARIGFLGARLRPLVDAAPERHLPAGLALKLLADAVGSGGHHRVRGVQQPLGAAERALQAHNPGARVLEAPQVLGRGAPEAVDRLVVVADRGHVVAGQLLQQRALRVVGVLELVHQDVGEAGAHPVADLGVLAQQPMGAQDQVAEVQRSRLGQHAVVGRVDGGELPLAPTALVVGQLARPGLVLLRGHQLVLEPVEAVDEGGQQRGRVAVEVVATERERVDTLQQQGQAVGGRDRRRERVEPRRQRLVVQQPGAEGVEGGDGQLLVGPLHRRLDARSQLVGGRGREREHQDPLRPSALPHQPGEAGHQRAGLPRARAGHHQQPSPRMGDGLALGVGETVEDRCHAPRI